MLAMGLAAVTAVLASAGCAKFDAALGKREAVVAFKAGTTQPAMMKVRAACGQVPGVKPEAVPASVNPTKNVYDVRYLISGASDADVAKLQNCLQRFPSVQGVSLINVGEEGG